MPPPPSSRRASAAALHPGPEPVCELRVHSRENTRYGIGLYRRGSARYERVSDGEQVVRVWGLSVMDHALAAIRRAGYLWTDLRGTGRAPFRMEVEHGARLGLLLAPLKPVRTTASQKWRGRSRRQEREKVSYCFSKLATGAEQGQIQRALRTMVSDE